MERHQKILETEITEVKRIISGFEDEDGEVVFQICQKRLRAEVLNGLRETRRSIENSEIDKEASSRALIEIDRVISRMESKAR